jgi:hypothetical protein
LREKPELISESIAFGVAKTVIVGYLFFEALKYGLLRRFRLPPQIYSIRYFVSCVLSRFFKELGVRYVTIKMQAAHINCNDLSRSVCLSL